MKILIDIGHPAHVHYFRNFVSIMKSRGHKFLITARDKEVTQQLLRAYNLDFVSRGKGKSSLPGKAFYLLQGTFLIYLQARRFRPDVFLSASTPYAAYAAKLMRKPHIGCDDTEHAKLNQLIHAPFTDVILSPSCYYAPYSSKQIYFNGYMELCYLHPKYFVPDPHIFSALGIADKSNYVILRFVSWAANHDISQKGLTSETKRRLISELSKYARVFISCEGRLPSEFEPYRLAVLPEKLHSVLAYARLYVGEGSTTASECSVLGTPNIYINSLLVGYVKEQQDKYGLCRCFSSDDHIVETAVSILKDDRIGLESKIRSRRMISEKMCPTDFMVWFIEKYPLSLKLLGEYPDYQSTFK